MTEITAKPFDWNDNLSKETIDAANQLREEIETLLSEQNIDTVLEYFERLSFYFPVFNIL